MVQGCLSTCGPSALAEDERPSGPKQFGRGVKGQYVYWITQPHPKPETIAKYDLKSPSDFTREEFCELVVKAHGECSVNILETAGFMEPHASGKMHHNCLCRADATYRWKSTAEQLFDKYKVRVNFGCNIRTWAEGVVYGRVASDHKPPEGLDKSPVQWAKSGDPVKFEDVIPRKWLAEGYQRKTKLSYMAVLDLCREHSIRTDEELWAVASDLEGKGDKALMAFAMESDTEAVMAKVNKAMCAKESLERKKLTRVEILQKCAADSKCSCPTSGLCYNLLKDVLQKNGLDGEFQRLVIGTLQAGRLKQRKLCIIGSANMGKSFLFKPLTKIFRTFRRPDTGGYQLESLLGKEILFLNDYEYNESTQKLMDWSYLKDFLEGEPVTIAVPKNRGGDKEFTSDAPVFFTAPQEISLWRKGTKQRDDYETNQMAARIKYLRLSHVYSEDDRRECNPCACCGARIYLEGLGGASYATVAPSGVWPARVRPAPQSVSSTPPKRRRTATEIVQELKDAKALKDQGVISSPELKDLKERLLRAD